MKNITYINAGAGSGKTYTLTEKLFEVLGSKKARPDEVILTTFTVKAANDFKEKAKAKLFEKGLFDEANMLDGALIGTIHSVAYSIISKFWYYLGLPPKPQIMTEDDGDVYRSQSLGNLPTKEELDFLKEFAEKFEIKDGRNVSVDYDFWRGHLNAIIGFTTNYEISAYDRSREVSKGAFAEFVNPNAPALPTPDEVRKAIEILKGIFDCQKESAANNNRKETLKELSRRASRPSFALYREQLKLGTSITATKKHPDIARINEKLTLMWQTKEVYDYMARYIDLAFDLAERWRDQYLAFKRERNILDFNDLEKYLLELLRQPYAAAEIGAKYRYVFVDEFQDCSPIQIKIFTALSELAEHSYWVGDMKQSIYGFRGSDTPLIDAVIKTIEDSAGNGCEIMTLPKSWRSVPEIVELCNSIFVSAFSPEIPESRVRLEPERNSDGSVEPLVLWNLESKDDIGGLVANMIADGVKPSEIAILNRMGDPLNYMADLLTGLNIPVNLSTEPIMSSKAALLAKAILSVADNDADSLAKGEVAFLLDPHYTTENIISDTLDHINPDTLRPDHSFLDEIPVLKRLSKIRSRLTQQSIAEFVESVILELNLYEEAMKCCGRKESVRVLTAIVGAAKTFEEVCLRLDTTPTVKGFIDYLDSGSVSLPGDPDGVVLLTMHSSKGLEWKHVIVTSLSSHPADTKKIMKRDVFGVHFRRKESPSEAMLFPEVHITLMPFVYGSGNTNVPAPLDTIIANKPEFSRICKDKILEETRLLYVAMTRPSHQLVMSLSGKNPLQWLADMGLEEYADAGRLADSFGFSCVRLENAVEIESAEVPNMTYRIEREDTLHERRDYSPSMLQGRAAVRSHRDFGRRIPLGKLPKDVDMDTVGNCLHHIYRLSGKEFADAAAVARIIGSYGLGATLCDTNEIEAAWRRLLDYISERHGACLALDHERPFIMHRGGKAYSGSIDLTATVAGGVVLVDYKTCPLGNDRILDEDDTHFAGLYGGQLDCYRKALQTSGHNVVATYVYYPVSGLIVEF